MNASDSDEGVPRSIPKKRFGQHFLTDRFYAERIASAVEAKPNDVVLEIGPGKGAVTRFLAQRFPRLQCVEIDRSVIPLLKKNVGSDSLAVHCVDFLCFDLTHLGRPLHVVGNLPYNSASRIMKRVLMQADTVASCTFMVQREVAQRICASAHTRSIGFLTIFCNYFSQPRILFHVPPGAFFPKPAVESSVVRLCIDPVRVSRIPPEQWNDFFSFVDAGFGMRRKKLVNSLTALRGEAGYAAALARLGIPPAVRAEDLDTAAWIRFYKNVVASK